MLRYQTEHGILTYTIENNKICITGYDKTDGLLAVPGIIEGYPVCGIGKKAFLGNQIVQHVSLPETVEWIDDWAFCNCIQLQSVELPYSAIRLGKGIFAKDTGLRQINCRSREEHISFPGRLLAVAVTLLDAEYLLDVLHAGSVQWYEQLDNRLITLLMEPVENTLKDLVYCAEEDMGAKQEAHLAKQNCRKAYMALLRLTYPEKLTEETTKKLKACLLDREGLLTKDAWRAIKESNGQEQLAFCNIMIKINGIREENFPAVLEDLGNAFVELKAYLLNTWEQESAKASIWDTLSFGS